MTAIDYAILKLTPEMAGMRMSPEEFDAVEERDEDYNYELVEGVLVLADALEQAETDDDDDEKD